MESIWIMWGRVKTSPVPGTLARFLFTGLPLPDLQPSAAYPTALLAQTPAIAELSTSLPNSEDIPMSRAWNPSSHTPHHGNDGEEERKFSTGNRRLVNYFDNGREKQKGRCQKTKR